MAEANDWAPVGKQPQDDWQPVGAAEVTHTVEPFPDAPDAFVDRVRVGQAINRVLSKTGQGAKEGFGEERLGLSEQHTRELQEAGVFRNPVTGRGGSLFLETLLGQGAVPIDALMRTISAGVHGAGSFVGQLADELGAEAPNRAKNETVNFLNYLMLRGDMNIGRAHRAPEGPTSQTIGTMPREADFKTAAQTFVMDVPIRDGKPDWAVAETNLRRLWHEDGIHPAEAVHDAERDAWLKHQVTAPVEAYHGSPHDFEAFDVSKIGTGEGAQAYGHGLYFAEKEGVARAYRENVTRALPDSAEDIAQSFWLSSSFPPSRENAVSLLKRRIAEGKTQPEYAEALRLLEDGWKPPEGNMYRVRIHADKEQFLDWDKPLSEQSEFVKERLRRIGADVSKKETAEEAAAAGTLDPSFSSDTGADLVHKLGDIEPGSAAAGIGAHKVNASNVLREAGIPGIKYLDQGSRGKGDGSRNFVVFDDAAVEITHKNGEPFYDQRFREAQDARIGQIISGQAEGEIPLRAVGAEVTSDPPLIPLSRQPPPPPGSVSAAIKNAGTAIMDIGRDLQMMLAPMAAGSRDSMAIGKDFANALRRNRWEWARIDDDVAKRFTPEQRKRMWDAADEESVMRQTGETSEHMGLATLTPEERAAVEDLQSRAQAAWLRARDLGMVEGEGLPAYTPRMVLNVATGSDRGGPIPLNGVGYNLRTKTGQMKRREYLTAEETEAAAKRLVGDRAARELKSLDEINAEIDAVRIARDIRALPLATAKLEDAVAGRTLIDAIKDYGKRTGTEAVSEGAKPDKAWFTLDHPAFRTWRPKFETVDGKVEAVKNADGNVIFEQVPIYVHGDFEGPLRAVLDHKSGATYGALMSLKGKTMSLIMNSPLIHNAVEWGRALPAMPGKVATFKVYFEGNRAKNDVPTMREAIDAGLVPIGKRFFNQDITSIMEAPDLAPGRSLTAKVLGFVPGLFDEGARVAVRAAIDKAGDFWHNTLLWDRVADLQMGLYVNFRDGLIEKGVDRQTASRAAAHWANRYAGALPQEAMSDAARKIANMLLFSRSFTMGNLGAMKDMLNGLPRDVMAQIERDAGFRPGAIAAAEAGAPADVAAFTKTMARRKAMAIVTLDMGLMYIGNSLLQNGMNVLLGDSTLEKEMHGYAERFSAALSETREHPMKLLQPFQFFQSLSATEANEPGRQERIKVGYAKDGTAIYARNPAGKIGEEFLGYLTGPLDMVRRKLGTIARPTWQIMANDAGFGRKVYDPNADTPAKYLKNMGLIAAHLVKSQFPEGQISAASDLVKGEGDPKVAALQALGPIAGVTFSKGAPGGPAVGELYYARSQHQWAIDAALPDIRRQIQRGDLAGAQERMTELGIAPGLQRFYVRTSLNPATRLGGRTLRDFYLYATPEQRQRLEGAR